MSAAAPAQAPLVLQLLHVDAMAGGRRILRDITLELRAGETLVVVGPSGAGKSTLARLAVGLVPAAAGEVRLLGEPLAPLGTRERKRTGAQAGFIYQDPQRSLNPRMTVAALITEGLEVAGGRPPGPSWGTSRRNWRREQACPWLERVGLDASLAGAHPDALSGGQRQRVAVARALAARPQLLVADEPVAALDPPTAAALVALLAELQRGLGLACLVVSHQIAPLAVIADRVAVLAPESGGGVVVESGPAEAMLRSPRHPLTRALLAALPPWPPSAGTTV